MASMTGLRVPAANGATVRGTRAADISLVSSRQLKLDVCNVRVRASQKPNGNSHVWAKDGVWVLSHWLRSLQYATFWFHIIS